MQGGREREGDSVPPRKLLAISGLRQPKKEMLLNNWQKALARCEIRIFEELCDLDYAAKYAAKLCLFSAGLRQVLMSAK